MPRAKAERRLWSTVVQKAAVELTERAREISDAVTTYTKERMPDLFDDSEALEANRASTEASIRDFAEVLRSGADPVKAVKTPAPRPSITPSMAPNTACC